MIILNSNINSTTKQKQAGAELCQAQASWPIKVDTFGKLRTLKSEVLQAR